MRRFHLLALVLTMVLSGVGPAMAQTQKPVRLFILSGQSNMKRMDADVSFVPAVKAAFPNDEVIVVKQAQGGQPIRRWYKGWKDETGALPQEPQNGKIYDSMMGHVAAELKGKPAPVSVVFVWMQGENDSNTQYAANVYEASLKGLIAQLRGDMKRPNLPVVVGRVSNFTEEKSHAYYPKIREAQVSVAAADPLVVWVNTDDLHGDSNTLHCTEEGFATLGKRFAEAAIAMSKEGWKKTSDQAASDVKGPESVKK